MSQDQETIGKYEVTWPEDNPDGSSKVNGVITPIKGAENPQNTIFRFSSNFRGAGRMWMMMHKKTDYPKYLIDAINKRALR